MNEASYKILDATNGSKADVEQRFWRRQFAAKATRPQIKFDVIVGIILPILCLVFDPIVFRSRGFGGGPGLLKDFQLFAYTVITLEVLTLALWLALGARAGSWLSAIGGILLAGALFSFVIAVVILPFSILGLMFAFIGALGFTPFITAFIYLRNGRRALKAANAGARGYEFMGALLLGMVFVIGGPAVAQWKISEMVAQSVQELTGGERKPVAAATQSLKYLSWIIDVDLDRLVQAYTSSNDPACKERLARVYEEITGQSIERRLRIMSD